MFKKSAQQGRSYLDERSVHAVREHGKMARTPLAVFFNIPILQCLGLITQGQKKTGNLFPDSPLKSTACRHW